MNIQDKTSKENFLGNIFDYTTSNISKEPSKNKFADIDYNFKNEQSLRNVIKNMGFVPIYRL